MIYQAKHQKRRKDSFIRRLMALFLVIILTLSVLSLDNLFSLFPVRAVAAENGLAEHIIDTVSPAHVTFNLFDYLMSETSFEPIATDNYFEQYVYEKPTIFVVQGKEVVVTSKRLADALANLSEQRRNVLLMNFFLGYSERKIGNEYGRSRSTVNYWKLAALKQLRKELEETKHEE